MAYTYDASPFILGQNATQQNMRDTVRFLVGDTDDNDPQLQDTEVDGLLQGNVASGALPMNLDPFAAAVAACIGLAAKYSRRANKTTGDLSIQSGAIAKAYRDMIPAIKGQAQRYATPVPYSGGLSKGDMDMDKMDDDLNGPQFTVGMDDDPNQAPGALNGGGFSQVVPG